MQNRVKHLSNCARRLEARLLPVTHVITAQRRSLQNFRNDNILPYYKIGGKVIYDEAEIEAWLDANYHPRY